MKQLNQKGIAALAVILLIIVAGIIGGSGWYVYNAQKKTQQTLDNTSKSLADPQKAQKDSEQKLVSENDPTKNWKAYSSKEGKFSLRYPQGWVQATHPELCPEGWLLLGATAATVGKCGSDSGGQMSISTSEGDTRAQVRMDKTLFPDLAVTPVTLHEVMGEMLVGTYKEISGGVQGIGALKDGTIHVQYIFYTNNKTYLLQYFSRNNSEVYPDVLGDFNTMVIKTLKFQP